MSIIPGVTYTYRSDIQSWDADGRDSLLATNTVNTYTPEVAGALSLGAASYSIPSDALYVAQSGSDVNSGSISSPFATLKAAIAEAANGSTIVIRAGEYRENAGSISGKELTIQNYPGEKVWFDGSDVETSWTASGAVWWTPLSVKFSHTAGHSQGVDETARYTDSLNPLAAWTDMVFIDGDQQWQVASNPTAGQFSVDYAANRVYVGIDPAGHEVRVAKRTRFLILNGKTTLRGIGFRRYATETWELGAVYIGSAGGGSIIENCHAYDIATQAISVVGDDVLVSKCTILRPGQTGIHGDTSHNIIISNCIIYDHNRELFRTQPHCGGIKLTRARDLTIKNNIIDGLSNRSSNVWLDWDCWGGSIVNNYCKGGRDGVFVEASGRIIVAGNFCEGNANTYAGVLLTISQECLMYNNWANNARGYLYAVWQDDREAAPGELFYDEGLRWHAKNNELVNNVGGGNHTLFMWYNRNDGVIAIPHEQMVTKIQSNLFSATSGQSPPVSASRLAGYVDGAAQTTYSQISTFEAARSTAIGNRLTALQSPTRIDLEAITGLARVLPVNVADAMGVPVNVGRVGPPRPVPVEEQG